MEHLWQKINGNWVLKTPSGRAKESASILQKKLSKNILIVDGQPGCGKTLFNRILIVLRI